MNNEVKNCVIVETAAGDSTFFLQEGDIFQTRADVYIFNSYRSNESMLIHQLQQHFQLDTMHAVPFYFAGVGEEVRLIQIKNGPTFLILYSDVALTDLLSIETYERYIRLAFTALSALESLHEPFQTVAFPVLYRNCIRLIYKEAVSVLIEQTTQWLKRASQTKTVKYVLFEPGDADIWNENLNELLGRKIMPIHKFSQIEMFRNRALANLSRVDRSVSYWDDTIMPLRSALQRSDFRPEVVAAFSRKLLEVYCVDQIDKTKVLDDKLDTYLKYMRSHHIVTNLKLQDLYQIRAFGNPSIHKPTGAFSQLAMDDKDVTIMLICLCTLLELVTKQAIYGGISSGK